MTSEKPITQPAESAGGAPAFIQTLVKLALRSPLHFFASKNLMLITFTGRKSGKQYTTPVTYVEDGADTIYLTTDGKWWRNLVGGATVTLLVRGKKLTGTATVIEDHAKVEAAIRGVIQKSPKDAYAYLITPNPDGSIKPEEMERAINARKRINVKLHR